MMQKIREAEEIIPCDPTCAWCLQEQGLLDDEKQKGKSHGICIFHAKLEVAKLDFMRVKPFFERFRRR